MENPSNEQRIQKMSRRLRRLFQVCTYTLPLVPVVYWLGYNHLPQMMHNNVFSSGAPSWLPLNSRLIALFGGVPAIVILVLALIGLKRLFSLYERGIYFQAENVVLFRLLGKLAFCSVVADVFNKTVLEVARTINNPPGERILSIGLSSDHLKLLVVAVIIMIIGMVIDEGRKIQDEIQLTV
ncbi:MAG: DUF2975 domain-containing protein [Desulfoprunum sp.]|nr:DUF2975 domain-containing protein [Desulfoprunum sp.]